MWIGEIQWMRRNGFEAARNPILRTLNTIENRDAILNADGTRAEWPKADVVVGNPPFLGAKKMNSELGEKYTQELRLAWGQLVPGLADLVCYWFAKANHQIQIGSSKRSGLVATNSVRDGASRDVLKSIVESGRIFEAWSDEEWTIDGAAVRVSLVCFDKSTGSRIQLNGLKVDEVHSNLTASKNDTTTSQRLVNNLETAFIGVQKNGPFDVVSEIASQWLLAPVNPNGKPNSIVLKRLLSGRDIVERDRLRWIVDFFGFSELRKHVV